MCEISANGLEKVYDEAGARQSEQRRDNEHLG
jgi:hypothetical protein